MRLQFLGDARDSFKWDFLHYLAVNAGFRRLSYVPFLTPDEPSATAGQTTPDQFPCRKEILRLSGLLRKSRNLNLISKLGHLDHKHWFSVDVYHADEYVGEGNDRYKYLAELRPSCLSQTVLFFDPDNGFETKTQRGNKWVLHQEVREVLGLLPGDSAIVVYQHRPRRSWEEFLPELRTECKYAPCFYAIHEVNLSFVLLTKNSETGARLVAASKKYKESRKDSPSLNLWEC